ncbi:unnamed protein product, partial [Musa hybrid cultivar]
YRWCGGTDQVRPRRNHEMSVTSAFGCGAAFLSHLSAGSRSGSTLILLRAGGAKPRPYSSSLARCAAPELPDVSRLADTARISLTPEEVEQFAPKIRQVIDWFGQLQAVDLETIEPSLRADTDASTSQREDAPETFGNREAIIAAVPSYDDPYIKVPKNILNKVAAVLDAVSPVKLFIVSTFPVSCEQRADKARRIISAADIRGTGSRVLAALPTLSFVDRVVESAPCELLVAIHESLFVLAMIKESHDRVRCWQGGVDAVPERFSPFDAMFICYFPGMGVSIDQLLSSLSGKSSPGSVVLSFDQGREVIEQNHRQQYPDMVTNNLPDRTELERAATEHSFQITEFVDEPTFYLAVLRFHD